MLEYIKKKGDIMRIRNFSKIDLYYFKEIIPDKKCINTEAILLLIPDKEKKYKVFKDFYIDEGPYFSNKLATINTLHDYKKEIGINELVYPEELVSVNNNIKGYLMEHIIGVNLSRSLRNHIVTLEEKIDFLKQVSYTLKKVKELRKIDDFKDFHIGDLHEDNILIDTDGKIHMLDMDSAKIGGNLPSPSKYLVNLKKKGILNSKYKLNSYDNEIIDPNEETDNYCFSIMLLNFLYQDNITLNSIEHINNYIDYLSEIGINKELVDIFYNLYTDKPNFNCSYFLDSINEKVYKKASEYKKGK